jgi:hypothetical protein
VINVIMDVSDLELRHLRSFVASSEYEEFEQCGIQPNILAEFDWPPSRR